MKFFFLLFIVLLISSCGSDNKDSVSEKLVAPVKGPVATCYGNLPKRYGTSLDTSKITSNKTNHFNMVRIPAGEFLMGAADEDGRPDEYPAHQVKLSAYWIDVTEVTNAQFRKFADATGYITTAECKPDWEELKKQLPPDTPKPADSVLVSASLVFYSPKLVHGLADPGQWWKWQKGADWKHPQGPDSGIKGKDDYPVVQVSWDDCMAYCKWAGKRLPTEAEWEYAARGGLAGALYPWGNEDVESGKPKANTWQGNFPVQNTQWDRFYGAAPVKQFAANGYGLYDVAGNVWEWCTDVLKGGSFMCNASYCKGYRVSSKMKSSKDTGLENTGFRCVSTN